MPPVTESTVASWANGKNLKFYFGAAYDLFMGRQVGASYIFWHDMTEAKQQHNEHILTSSSPPQDHSESKPQYSARHPDDLWSGHTWPNHHASSQKSSQILVMSSMDWMVCACLRSCLLLVKASSTAPYMHANSLTSLLVEMRSAPLIRLLQREGIQDQVQVINFSEALHTRSTWTMHFVSGAFIVLKTGKENDNT